MFNSYTTTGSFSRSAINNSVGAKTPLAQCVTGLMIMVRRGPPPHTHARPHTPTHAHTAFASPSASRTTTSALLQVTLLCLTEVFENMSANTQGAIVMVGVIPLFDFKELPYLWRVSKLDLLSWLTGERAAGEACAGRVQTSLGGGGGGWRGGLPVVAYLARSQP